MMNPTPLRIIFMGTPDFAVPTLRALHQAGHQMTAVYTRAPKPKGRGQQVAVSPVHKYALDHGLGPIMTPVSFRRDPAAVQEFLKIPCDVVVVAAYGLILPPNILNAPRFGCLNVHGSLLPRWRGAAPIQHAIWAGDFETGVTIMQMDQGLDTGDMIVSHRVPISSSTTTPMLYDTMAPLGAELMLKVINDLAQGRAVARVSQPDAGATLAPMLTKEDGLIDWSKTAAHIDRQIRALTSWPGTYSGDFKILQATPDACLIPSGFGPGIVMGSTGHVVCGQATTLRVDLIQTPQGKKMTVKDAINGGLLRVGAPFGGHP